MSPDISKLASPIGLSDLKNLNSKFVLTISGKDFELIAIDDEVDIMRVTGSVDGNRMSGAYYNFYEGIYGIFTGTKM